jgi:hypothetical protein
MNLHFGGGGGGICVMAEIFVCRCSLWGFCSTQNCILGKWPTWRPILSYVFISVLYMFRATSCSSSGDSTVSIQHLVYVNLYRWPFCVQVGKFLSDLHTKRSRCCSKHVENWNKYIEKNCASSWSFTKNHNKMLHGQQNTKLYCFCGLLFYNWSSTGYSEYKT